MSATDRRPLFLSLCTTCLDNPFSTPSVQCLAVLQFVVFFLLNLSVSLSVCLLASLSHSLSFSCCFVLYMWLSCVCDRVCAHGFVCFCVDVFVSTGLYLYCMAVMCICIYLCIYVACPTAVHAKWKLNSLHYVDAHKLEAM